MEGSRTKKIRTAPELNDNAMTMMKFFRTLFVAAALVGMHWMGMSMARTFDAPSEHRAARIQVERVDETAPPVMDAIPGQTAVAG